MKKKKRLLSLLLVLMMVLGLLPIEPFTITAQADWIDPDDFAICQFCGEIYDNTADGCYFCGLHDPCLEDNLDEEEVQAHFENCVSGGMGFCEECWEIVEFDCDCGWHGGDENGEGGHGLNNDATFADHFALCITEFEEFTCDDCGLDPFSDEGWISFDESEWCATCGCHLECFENADPDSFTQTELYHAVGCENLQQCQICYQLFPSDTLCEDCGWHEDSGCVPLHCGQLKKFIKIL